MKYEFKEVTYKDLDMIKFKSCYSNLEIGPARDMLRLAEKTVDSVCLGFGNKDKLFGIAGSFRQWEGSALAWAIFGEDADVSPIELSRACRTMIIYAKNVQKLHRISLTVRSGYTKGNRFAKHLGFEFEGVMKKYFPDQEDANLYARVF